MHKAHVKTGRGLRYDNGAHNVLVAGGVGYGKVLLWEVIHGAWNGAAAADLYQGPMRTALLHQFPGVRFWKVLEDNDPTGDRSRLALQAKVGAKIHTVQIPKRSPDLNVMDYYIWSEVERRLRKQEHSWPSARRETRQQFMVRLARVARALPGAVIDKAIGDMARRADVLYEAKGGLFEEGGGSK